MKVFHPKLKSLALALGLLVFVAFLPGLNLATAALSLDPKPAICTKEWFDHIFRDKIDNQDVEFGSEKINPTEKCALNKLSESNKVATVPTLRSKNSDFRKKISSIQKRIEIDEVSGRCETPIEFINRSKNEIHKDLIAFCKPYLADKSFESKISNCKVESCITTFKGQIQQSREQINKLKSYLPEWIKLVDEYNKNTFSLLETRKAHADIVWKMDAATLKTPEASGISARREIGQVTLSHYKESLGHPDSLKEPHKLLTDNPHLGSLGKELRWSLLYSEKFKGKLKLGESEIIRATEKLDEYTEELSGVEKAQNNNNPIANAGKLAENFKGAPTPTAPPAKQITSSIAGSGSGGALLVGATGAALASRGATGGSREIPFPTPPGLQDNTPKQTEGTALGNKGTPGAVESIDPQANKTDDKKTEAPEVTFNASGSAPVFASGSASTLKNGGKLRPAKKDNRNPAAAGVDEAKFSPFSGELKYNPKPKSPGNKGGTEVADLLNQMKKLFDPSMGGDFGGGPPPPPEAEGEMGEGQFAQNGNTNGGEGYEENGYSSSEGSETYSIDENGQSIGDPSGSQASAAIGGRETNLFSRVRKRHKICLEKGWVVSSVGGIPQ